MKNLILGLLNIICLLLLTNQLAAQNEELFQSYGAGAGKCFGKALISYDFDTIEEKIVLRPAYSYMREIPAKYKTTTERILVEPAHTRYEIVPPEFEYSKERIQTKPAESYTTIDGPPSESSLFTEIVETMEVKPASQKWEKTKKKKNCKSKNEEDCLEWQLVDVPAEYTTIIRKIRSNNTSTSSSGGQKVIRNPAQFIDVTKKTLKKQGEYRAITVPAKYKSVTKQTLIEPRRFEQVTIPAEYKTIQKVIVIKDGGVMEAKEVLCEDDYPIYLYKIQQKLINSGYDIGGLDGVLGKKTKAAIMDFQAKNGLPIGQLDYGTIKAMGLIK